MKRASPWFLGLSAAAVLVAAASFAAPARAAAARSAEETLSELAKLAPAERQKRLEEGAKKEGAVQFYSNENIDLLQRGIPS